MNKKTIVTYSLDSELVEKFRRVCKGEMSKTVNNLIKGYINMSGQSSQEVKELHAELDNMKRLQQEAKVKESNLLHKIELSKIAEKEKLKEKESINEDCTSWINSEISDAKLNRNYTELVYYAEKAGLTVEKYLENKYYEALAK